MLIPLLSRGGISRSSVLSSSLFLPPTLSFVSSSSLLFSGRPTTLPSSQHPTTQQQHRHKHTKVSAYRRPSRSGQSTRAYIHRPHIGIRATAAEYVETGRTVVKQRKYIAKNPHVTRNKHFKLYPGENVKVVKDTSIVAICSGRVKYTHDVVRNVKIANVMPESREELKTDDLWRYRTEHVRSMEENKVGVVFGSVLFVKVATCHSGMTLRSSSVCSRGAKRNRFFSSS